ncbi:hypothetical protein CQW49_08540 [Methylosinus trichosporium OB3b]|uniref:Uncharacterized protein n=2 Tax=Methylocystaceae TaxID=31993 RepID=A0A2D2CYX1_METT3|nr:hypothetical protein CQW49_08540 [Methylosinus trichosporium OB3b]OBS53788.1 hypothetical protein A8B73_04660 [Methylosinus sp. 3S-1]
MAGTTPQVASAEENPVARAEQQKLLLLMEKLNKSIEEKSTDATTAAAVAGQFVVNFTVKLKAPVSDPITCAVTVAHFGSAGATYLHMRSASATKSGLTATCKIVIPYDWKKANSAIPVSISPSLAATQCACPGNYYQISLPSQDIPLPSATTATTTVNVSAVM